MPLNVSFEHETNIDDCNKALKDARWKMVSKIRDGFSQFECLGFSKEYQDYKGRIGLSVLVYALGGIATLLDAAFNGGLTGNTGITLLFETVNTVFVLINLPKYISSRKWYKEKKVLVAKSYYNNWQNILADYYEWCRKNNEPPLQNMYITDIEEEITIAYKRY